MGPNDTAPEAAQVQIELLRQMSPQRRLTLALSLSSQARALAFRAIERQWPALDEQEVRLKFIELHYGAALAAKVREHLACRT